MRRLISAFATAGCTAALMLLPAATAHAVPAGCVYSDSTAITAADPTAVTSLTFPEGAINPEGQVCHHGTWVGPSIDDGSYDSGPGA
ncbi:hypothetical protein P3T35_004159 [Kitasatospora sp. GP30]|uniref:hypothetical protein n=1 Tax=Kitasatospora sp. GP30 TaxID=3035084 RepID=UPI000C704E76|nr:hypothetical protein [Kitasatospora sp. GP30]MDH6142138.1 hypothetical protein [Kitasatospora sp. GP30]